MYRHGILKRLLLLPVLPVLLALCHHAGAAETIPLYVSYADPPLSLDRDDSLTLRLAAALSEQSHGRYQFQAKQLPRKRMTLLINEPNWKGVVAWANPTWFGDENRRRFAWSKPYMVDTNLVISLRSHPVEYSGSGDSLSGLRVGTIFGHRYPDFERQLRQHQFARDDVGSELQNLQKLRLGRLDVALVQSSSLPFFRATLPELDSWIYVSHETRGSFQRFLFTHRQNTELMAFLDGALAALAHDPLWQPLFSGTTLAPQPTAPRRD